MTTADPFRRYLGGGQLAANAASLVVTIPACQSLSIEIMIAGFSVSDTPAVQFNGDTGSTYHYALMGSAAGATTFTLTATNSTSKAFLSPNASTGCASVWVTLTNFATVTKVGSVCVQQGTGAVATTGALVFGEFEWINTTSQITSITLLGNSGNSLLAGTTLRVTGSDFL